MSVVLDMASRIGDAGSSMASSAKASLGLADPEPEPPSFVTRYLGFLEMSMTQRVTAFVVGMTFAIVCFFVAITVGLPTIVLFPSKVI
jgi:hypothetical protein